MTSAPDPEPAPRGARHPILGSLAALAGLAFAVLFVLTFVYAPKLEAYVQDFATSMTKRFAEGAEDSELDHVVDVMLEVKTGSKLADLVKRGIRSGRERLYDDPEALVERAFESPQPASAEATAMLEEFAQHLRTTKGVLAKIAAADSFLDARPHAPALLREALAVRIHDRVHRYYRGTIDGTVAEIRIFAFCNALLLGVVVWMSFFLTNHEWSRGMLIAPALLLFLSVGLASWTFFDRSWVLTIVFHRHWGWGYLILVAQSAYSIHARWSQVVDAMEQLRRRDNAEEPG